MNEEGALGLLEVYGLAAAVVVADEMAKAAPVDLLPRLEIGAGLVTIVARGGVSAVQEAIAAGRRRASAGSALRSASVLGRPAPGVADLFFAAGVPGRGGAAPPARIRSRRSVDRIRAPRAHSKKRGGISGG